MLALLYNRGSIVGPLLSGLCLLLQGVTERDQLVFTEVRKRGIPILMVTSGGYQVYYCS